MKHLLRLFILFFVTGILVTCKKEHPTIQITANPQTIKTGEKTQLTCALNVYGDWDYGVSYLWSSSAGIFTTSERDAFVSWKAPNEAGIYSIFLVVNYGPYTINGEVSITVEENPKLSVITPIGLNFGTKTTEKEIEIKNTGTGTLSWTINTNIEWVTFSEHSGKTTTETDKIIVAVNRDNLPPNKYTGNVTLTTNGGEEELIVKMYVTDILNNETSSMVDSRDSKNYKIIKIGDQWWMAENLAFDAGRGCYAYNNNESNVETYGRLYTWYAALEACPSGWHLPTDDEWKQMEIYIGMSQSEADNIDWRGTYEGFNLKATSGWNNNGNGIDNFGFSGLPGGYRQYNLDGSFALIGTNGYWWSATEYDTGGSRSYFRALSYDKNMFGRHFEASNHSFSVRCVKD